MRQTLLCSVFLLNFLSASLFAQKLEWLQQHSPAEASFRGLYVIDDSVVWGSGSGGTIIRTLDGGHYWELLPAPDSLDFRSLWAFGKEEVMVASAGQPAKVFYTADAGKHWNLLYTDTTGAAFFDALVFWDAQRGWLLGDPIKGKTMLLETPDRGKSWKPLDLPAPAEGEAFFAASNSSLSLVGMQHAWIGSGGSDIRIMASVDGGRNWRIQTLAMPKYSQAAGIYAVSMANESLGVAIGGAYDKPAEGAYAAYYTRNGGKSWNQAHQPPGGYRSGVAHIPGSKVFVAVGTNGSDISVDGGKSWRSLNKENLNSIRFSPSGKIGWAVGASGQIFKVVVNQP